MREIKFRAWDKENNCWFKPVYEAYKGNLFDLFIELSGNMVVHTSRGIEGNFINSDRNIKFWADRFELEQFTGLRDINGKEIYEGDIILNPLYEEPYVVEYSENLAGYVGWGDCRACGCYLITDEDIEVIGNIHENPELIK